MCLLPSSPSFFPMPSFPSSPPPTCCPSPSSPRQAPVCDAPLSVSMCSHCSTPTYEWEHVVFDFLFLCQFAENDGFQVHPRPYKGHKLIVFCGCIVFHGVYVPHLPVQSIIDWAFGLVPSLFYCKQCCHGHMCACVLIIKQFIIHLAIYPVMGLLGQIKFLFLDPWGTATLSSTMVELIYSPTNSVKVFLFLHILSSICCLLIF